MTNKTINESVLIRELVEVPNLWVFEDVLNIPLKFTVDSIEILITIPSSLDTKWNNLSNPSKSGYTTFPDGTKINHHYAEAIELKAIWPEPLRLPVTARNVHPRQEEHFTKNQIHAVDYCLNKLRDIGNQALKDWVNMCRWVTGTAQHGDIERDFTMFLPDPSLRISETGHKFWGLKMAPNRVLHVHRSISLKEWIKIGSQLSEGVLAPIWYNYIFEAQNRLFRRDAKGAILIAAIACETLVRHCFSLDIKEMESGAVKEIIDNVNIRQIIERFKKIDSLSGLILEKHSIIKLHKLFDMRNDIIHSASLTNGKQDNVTNIIENARTFIDQVNRHINFTQRQK